MKRFLTVLLMLICCMGFAGCAQEPEAQSEAKTINIGVMPDVESLPLIIAEKSGYFEKEGVKVKIHHFKSAKDRDSALQSGKLDGVITDFVAVVFANEGGYKLKIVAKNDGNIELLAGKDSGINSVKDLKGHSVGLSTNTIMEYTTDKMLAASHLNPQDVQKIGIPQLPTRLEMLQGGKIDAAILPEPLAGLAVKNGAVVLTSTDEMANKAGAIAFTSKSLEENSQEIKAVLRAYNEGVAYLQKEPVANYVDFIIEEQGFPAELKESLTLPQYTEAELPDEKILMDVVEWMKDRGFIEKDYYYHDLVDYKILRD